MDNGVKSSKQENAYNATHHVVELKIPVPWGHIAVKAWNDPCGPPVIALHGTQDNAGSFNRLVPFLPSMYYYVCVDMPGHGLSSHFPPGLSLNFVDYVTVISRIALHFNWDKFILMGHSMGAHLISFYAGLHPENVEKLVMLDGIAPYGIPLPLYFDTYKSATDFIIQLEKSNTPAPSYTFTEVVERVSTKRISNITEDAAKELIKRAFVETDKRFSFSGDRRLRLNFHPFLTTEQILEVLKGINCPQLIIITKFTQKYLEGEIFRRAMALYNTRANVTYEYVDGGHDVHNESPHIIAPVISKFLLRHKSML